MGRPWGFLTRSVDYSEIKRTKVLCPPCLPPRLLAVVQTRLYHAARYNAASTAFYRWRAAMFLSFVAHDFSGVSTW